jgi:hypothetical protein
MNHLYEYQDHIKESFDEQETESRNIINFNNYLAKKLDESIQYQEYISESTQNVIDYSNHLSEHLNNSINYSEHLKENISNVIKHSDYIVENINSSGFSVKDRINETKTTITNTKELNSKIDKVLESIQKQKSQVLEQNIQFPYF